MQNTDRAEFVVGQADDIAAGGAKLALYRLRPLGRRSEMLLEELLENVHGQERYHWGQGKNPGQTGDFLFSDLLDLAVGITVFGEITVAAVYDRRFYSSVQHYRSCNEIQLLINKTGGHRPPLQWEMQITLNSSTSGGLTLRTCGVRCPWFRRIDLSRDARLAAPEKTQSGWGHGTAPRR